MGMRSAATWRNKCDNARALGGGGVGGLREGADEARALGAAGDGVGRLRAGADEVQALGDASDGVGRL